MFYVIQILSLNNEGKIIKKRSSLTRIDEHGVQEPNSCKKS